MKDFGQILDQMQDLYERKNADYGDSFHKNFERFGLTYPIPRMYEKLDRISTLTRQPAHIIEEKLEDTLIDLANLCVMTLVEMQVETKNEKTERSQRPHTKQGVEFGKKLMENLKKASMKGKTPEFKIELIQNAKKEAVYNNMPQFMKDDFEFFLRLEKGELTDEEVIDELLASISALASLEE